jgi:hypothetical protein
LGFAQRNVEEVEGSLVAAMRFKLRSSHFTGPGTYTFKLKGDEPIELKLDVDDEGYFDVAGETSPPGIGVFAKFAQDKA